jgi:peptide/nickel transport system ATP-binding protein
VSEPLLSIRDLAVEFGGSPALRGVSLDVHPGEALGLVGESGCGKSVTWLAALGLLPKTARIRGSVTLRGEEMLGAKPARLDHLRGGTVAMIFQDPASSLNPVHRIGKQIVEALALHQGLTGARRGGGEAAARPRRHARCGAAARRLSARALGRAEPARDDRHGARRPAGMLVADEPTTALDVTIQAQILDLLQSLRRDRNMALVLITHDLGVVAETCERVAVMYAGRIVEEAPVERLFAAPAHPYAQGLLGALPPLDGERRPSPPSPAACRSPGPCRPAAPSPRGAAGEEGLRRRDARPTHDGAGAPRRLPPRPAHNGIRMSALLEARELVRRYWMRRGPFGKAAEVRALDGVSLTLEKGRTLGLVGESGCGKSTTGRLVLGLEAPDSGSVAFEGAPMPAPGTQRLAPAQRARMQMVFQDPLGALDRRLPSAPRWPSRCHPWQPRRCREGASLLTEVGLREDHGARYPHELSGGQRQRAVLARALATSPDLLVCDEPISALDVSIQAQVMNLLMELQARRGMAMLFISHDLRAVRQVSHRVAVMYLGRIVEEGEPDEVLHDPRIPMHAPWSPPFPHPSRRGQRILLSGDPPNPADRPTGCAFHPRCSEAIARCRVESPALLPRPDGRMVACHLAHAPAAKAA